jgi:hypothetical protein
VELVKEPAGDVCEAMAAALAETGDFAGAIEWQKKAMGDAAYLKDKEGDAKKRLSLYETRSAYRDSTP